MLRNIFSGVDTSVMPGQLLQYERSPFFDSVKMKPFSHSLDGNSFSEMSLNSDNTCSRMLSSAAFEISPEITSSPAAVLIFRSKGDSWEFNANCRLASNLCISV